MYVMYLFYASPEMRDFACLEFMSFAVRLLGIRRIFDVTV